MVKKRLRYFVPALLQSHIVRPVVLRALRPLSWKTETRNQIKPPRGNSQQPATTLRPAQVCGIDGIHPRVPRELVKVLTELLAIIYQHS